MTIEPEALAETQTKYLALHEFVKAAKNRLDANMWDYLVGATETETTMRRNRMGIDALALRPRVLRDVSKIDSTASLLGKKIRLPVMLAPVGGLEFMAVGANGAVTAVRPLRPSACRSCSPRSPSRGWRRWRSRRRG